MKTNFGCPVHGMANVIAGKWKVLWHLGVAKTSPCILARHLSGL